MGCTTHLYYLIRVLCRDFSSSESENLNRVPLLVSMVIATKESPIRLNAWQSLYYVPRRNFWIQILRRGTLLSVCTAYVQLVSLIWIIICLLCELVISGTYLKSEGVKWLNCRKWVLLSTVEFWCSSLDGDFSFIRRLWRHSWFLAFSVPFSPATQINHSKENFAFPFTIAVIQHFYNFRRALFNHLLPATSSSYSTLL